MPWCLFIVPLRLPRVAGSFSFAHSGLFSPFGCCCTFVVYLNRSYSPKIPRLVPVRVSLSVSVRSRTLRIILRADSLFWFCAITHWFALFALHVASRDARIFHWFLARTTPLRCVLVGCSVAPTLDITPMVTPSGFFVLRLGYVTLPRPLYVHAYVLWFGFVLAASAAGSRCST